MPETKRPLKVFLCHAHADRETVRALYARLKREGVDVWLDKERLLPGANWEIEIRQAVRESDVVVVCLSKQFNQAGFRQKEVKIALDTAMEQPEGEIFIIPARLEECESPATLSKWHWVDLFEDDGHQRLIRALRLRAGRINATLRVRGSGQAISSIEKNMEPETSTEAPVSHVNISDTFIETEKISTVEEEKPERGVDEKVTLQEVERQKSEKAAQPKAKRNKVSLSATIPFTNLVSRNLQDEIGFDLLSATKTKFIGRTNHSSVEKCLITGKYYVVKRTIQSSCNPTALRHLIGKNITGNEGKVSVQVATPLTVWETDDYVWELYPFYKGITLREIILDNKYKIQGAILGKIFNALLGAVNRLHEQGILHRDISPSNILINGKDEHLQLTLIDCSFCCFEKQEQLPVQDPSYSAPEQTLGRAVRKSDLYSIAATIYFLGNGDPPPNPDDKLSLREGLKNLDSGNYWLSHKFKVREDTLLREPVLEEYYSIHGIHPLGKVVESLLKREAGDRPSNLAEILLQPVSSALEPFPLLDSVLKAGTLGYLIISSNGFRFFDKRKTIAHINSLRIEDEDLKKYVQTLLGESNIP
ncbi:MAG TPA: TIR domain-containing protein [Candidatus Deferrimicrobium sp.]|nr:TIR domain-containing protein [Candidatus Deferrimicrobium sp.]